MSGSDGSSFNLTAQDYELANEISRVMRESRSDFREASRYVLNQYQVEPTEWGERLRNIGHILSQRRKTGLAQIADDVSMLIHKGRTFHSALNQVLDERTVPDNQRGWYYRNVGRRLAAKKKKLAEQAAREVAREVRRVAAADKKMQKAAEAEARATAKIAKPAKKPAATVVPYVSSPLPLEMAADLRSKSEVRRDKRRQTAQQEGSKPAQRRSRRQPAAQGKLFS